MTVHKSITLYKLGAKSLPVYVQSCLFKFTQLQVSLNPFRFDVKA